MVALNFNAQQVAPSASLEPVPSGTYDVIITNSVEKPNSKNTGSYIEFEMTIRNPDPSLNNRKVFDRLNIKNPNQQAVDLAYGTLSAICHVTGRHQIQETQQLHNIPIKAIVVKVERTDQPGTFSNDVKGYKDANGNDPGSPGAASGGPAPQPNGSGAPQAYSGGQQPAPQGGQPQAQGGAPSWAGQQPAAGQGGNGGGYGGQPTGYQDYQGQGGPQQAPGGGQGGYGGVPHPNGQQVAPPAPGHAQQTSEQHYAAGPTQGAPQGGQPPVWAGNGGQPQGQPAPQAAPQQQPAPQAQQPAPGAAPPWVQN